MKKTAKIGNEYDPRLRDALMAVVRELGGHVDAQAWGVGGSQELESVQVVIGNRLVQIESETYIGLSVIGDDDLVEQIEALVHARLQGTSAN